MQRQMKLLKYKIINAVLKLYTGTVAKERKEHVIHFRGAQRRQGGPHRDDAQLITELDRKCTVVRRYVLG